MPAPDPLPVLLELRDLHVHAPAAERGRLRHRGSLRALAGVDLVLRAGQLAWLVGDQASGGAALGALLAAPGQPPDAGRIRIAGIDPGRTTRQEAGQLRRAVAVLGAPDAGGLTGHAARQRTRELVADLLPPDVPRAERPDRAAALLEECGVPARAHQDRVRTLAAPARSAVELAAALAARPAVLFADLTALEPALVPLVLEVCAALRASGSAVLLCAAAPPDTLEEDETLLLLVAGSVVEVVTGAGTPQLVHPAGVALGLVRDSVGAAAEGVADAEGRRPLHDPGCPYRERCVRAQGRCAAEMPPLVPPLGVDHPVACWFPEPGVRHAGQEPTARDFAQG